MSKASSKPAKGIVWQLNGLYKGPNDPNLEQDKVLLRKKVESFSKNWRTKINDETNPEDFLTAIKEYEDIIDLLVLISSYASLLYAQDSVDSKRSRLYVSIQEFSSGLQVQLLWFDLAIKALAADSYRKLAESPLLSNYLHHLEYLTSLKSFTLSEQEEKVITQKDQVGNQAFVRLYDQTDAKQVYPLEVDGKTRKLSYAELTSINKSHPSREVRQRGSDALTKGLSSQRDLYGYILNNLLLDKKINDELRGFKYPQQATLLAYEVELATVDSLVETVEANHNLVESYYLAKSRLVGDQLYEWDRYSAPFPEKRSSYTWAQAKQIVLDAFAKFSGQVAEIATEFFERGWIDAEINPGKRGGAFCSYTSPSHHPYVFVNFTGEIRDITTLAHELGHAIHGYLSRKNSVVNFWPSTATAEIASVFGESLVYDYLFEKLTDQEELLNLRAEKIQSSFATVFRQTAFYQFELDITNHRRQQGELTPDDFDRYFQARLQKMFGAGLTLSDGHKSWWMPVLHFYHYNFYVFTYAFGELLSQALYSKYRQSGSQFVPDYLKALILGGSVDPYTVTEQMGVDISRPEFWQAGLDLLAAEIKQFDQDLSRR